MKKIMLPLLISVAMLSGCASLSQQETNRAPAPQTKTAVIADLSVMPDASDRSAAPTAPAQDNANRTQPQVQSEPKKEPAPAPQPAAPAKAPTSAPAAPKPAPKPVAKQAEPAASSKQIVHLPNSQIDFDKVTIDCDLSDQMVYVKQDGKVVRSMPTSSGLDTIPDNSTPRGEFVIEPERGQWFYSQTYQEGAKYWVSFKNHGEFLFHSVVMDNNQAILQNEAKKLGTKASHGCFRLPLEDAKWIYDNIKTGTKVSIHD